MNKGPTGLVLVFTGNGKGKTTAALGTALRAFGQGMKVLVLQFIKGGWVTGEQKASMMLGPNFELRQLGSGFIKFDDPEKLAEQKKIAQQGVAEVRQAVLSGQYDLIVLDEVNYAIAYGLIPQDEVLEIIKVKPPELHLILTGRNASDEIIQAADLVTKMEPIKHPYEQGISAQVGIEY